MWSRSSDRQRRQHRSIIATLAVSLGLGGCEHPQRLVDPGLAQEAPGARAPACPAMPKKTGAIFLVPESATIGVGESVQLQAVNGRGAAVPECQLAWTSGNPGVASVDAQGNVTGTSVGSASIRAVTRKGKRLSAEATVTVKPPGDVTTALLAHYAMDGDAKDASGNLRHGTMGAGVTAASDRHGTPSSALAFDGGGGLVDIGQLDLTGAFTIAAWIRPDFQSVGAIVSRFSGPQGYELLYAGQQLDNCMRLHTSGLRGTIGFDCTTSLPLGTWVHVVGTYDGTSVGRIYLNGVLAAQGSGLLPDLSGGPNTLIGRSAWGAQTFQGVIDEVRIYSRALSSQDISYLATIP